MAGDWNYLIIERFPELGYEVDAYIGKEENNNSLIPTISIEEYIENYAEDYVIVYAENKNEIIDKLLCKGVSKEKIIMSCNSGCGIEYDYPMYFNDILKPKKHGVLIDGGCFNCGSIRDFIEWNKDYDYIYSFEPEPESFKKCEIRLRNYEKVKLLNYGLWSKSETLHFISNGAGSYIGECEDCLSVQCISIDEVVKDKKVTFIKLDVEGSEMEALKGAKKTIERNHPDLAISVYHKLEDLYDIPNFILNISSKYKLYLRHYQISKYETVLYARYEEW